MATSPEYTQQNYDTTFRMMTSDTQQGAAAGEFIVKDLGAKKVALIDDRTAYGQGLADQVAKAVEANGGKVIAREYTTDKANDFTAILTNIKDDQPDAIFFGGLDAQPDGYPGHQGTAGFRRDDPQRNFPEAGRGRRQRYLRVAGRRAAQANGSWREIPRRLPGAL